MAIINPHESLRMHFTHMINVIIHRLAARRKYQTFDLTSYDVFLEDNTKIRHSFTHNTVTFA